MDRVEYYFLLDFKSELNENFNKKVIILTWN